ncbi:DUF7529 family protein [Salinilacihabitans rarus]|uniref:DUF7529 family protein n=1 Tax=Salinilacihabitans rarus TaxID=2961596 RepID=UPI0020C87500|nr:hypothetical protein [Salinilacihabitans rarus]
MNGQGVPDAVLEFWEAFVDDVAATADAYRESGWDVLELHPGDVAPQPGPLDRPTLGGDEGDGDADAGADADPAPDPDVDRLGFDVLVPDDEFDALESLLDDGFAASSYETFRAERGGAAFVLVVERDEASERAVFVPLHYRPSDTERLRRLASQRGVVHAYVRPLSRRRVVTFSHEEPDSFFGDGEDAGDDPESA